MFGEIPKKLLIPLWMLSVTALGCGSNHGKGNFAEVTGTVSYLDGKPLAKGAITFENPTKGHVASGEIKDGKFSLKAHVGEMIVRIRVQEEYGKPDVTGVRPIRELIASNYNVRSKLKETVKEGGLNNFQFKVGRKK